MYTIVLTSLTAFLMTFFGIPSIIRIATKNKFLDQPDERRVHFVSTPSLGGIGIFAGTIFAIIMWTPLDEFSGLQYILSAFFIIFLVGAKDDIDPISVSKKLIGQILAAGIIIFLADKRILSIKERINEIYVEKAFLFLQQKEQTERQLKLFQQKIT